MSPSCCQFQPFPVSRKHKGSVLAGEEKEEEENKTVMAGGDHRVKQHYKCCEPQFFIQLVAITMLVLFAGLMSGLTLGLVSMSLIDLEVLAKSRNPQGPSPCLYIPVFSLPPLLWCFKFSLYRRAELKTLVDLHSFEAGKGGDLSRDEISIIGGALELTEKQQEMR